MFPSRAVLAKAPAVFREHCDWAADFEIAILVQTRGRCVPLLSSRAPIPITLWFSGFGLRQTALGYKRTVKYQRATGTISTTNFPNGALPIGVTSASMMGCPLAFTSTGML